MVTEMFFIYNVQYGSHKLYVATGHLNCEEVKNVFILINFNVNSNM
jgi:hypothetical protein